MLLLFDDEDDIEDLVEENKQDLNSFLDNDVNPKLERSEFVDNPFVPNVMHSDSQS